MTDQNDTGLEHRRGLTALLKGGLILVGGRLGAGLTVLIDYAREKATAESLQRAIAEINGRLNYYQERVDLESVDKDEFADLCNHCLLTIIQTTHEEKIRAASALIVNLLLQPDDPEKLPYTALDHFLKAINSLSIGAIKALGIIYGMMAGTPAVPTHSGTYGARFDFGDLRAEFAKAMPEADGDLLWGLIQELGSTNFVYLPPAPGIPTADFGNFPIILTSLGRRFVEHLLQESKKLPQE